MQASVHMQVRGKQLLTGPSIEAVQAFTIPFIAKDASNWFSFE